jgi:hypothetical protein
VIAFKNGQPLDGFMGALPESQVAAFIDRIAGPVGPSDAEAALEAAAEALAANDYAGAAGLYGAVLQAEPDNLPALGGLTRCFIALGEVEQARGLLVGLTPAQENDPAIRGARAALDIAEQAATLSPSPIWRAAWSAIRTTTRHASTWLSPSMPGGTGAARPGSSLSWCVATAAGTRKPPASSLCSSLKSGDRRTLSCSRDASACHPCFSPKYLLGATRGRIVWP